MLITRETDYALRILRALDDKTLKKSADISAAELVPRQFIYKIMKKLERAGMVEVRPGVGGGCRLVANLAEVNLLDLTEATGDILMVNACIQPDYDCGWTEKKDRPCFAHARLALLQQHIENEMRQITLAELCVGQEKPPEDEGPN